MDAVRTKLKRPVLRNARMRATNYVKTAVRKCNGRQLFLNTAQKIISLRPESSVSSTLKLHVESTSNFFKFLVLKPITQVIEGDVWQNNSK